MGQTLDLLIIHVPKFSSYYRPYGEFMTVNLLPMGTWALADRVAAQGVRTRILHLGLEWISSGDFSPLPFLQRHPVRAVAMALHWHQQSHDVLRIAESIKRDHPAVFVVLGGYTASYFHREILEGHPHVDAVIRGDAEKPLAKLTEALVRGAPLGGVPNLTWRDGEGVCVNPLAFVAGEDDLKGGCRARLDLLEDRQRYIRTMGLPFVWSKGLSERGNRRHFHLGPPVFPLEVGRGCTGACTWCGGGSRAQRLINGRRGVVFRPPAEVADTVAEALGWGYTMVHIGFDPGRPAGEFYRELFALLRQHRLRPACYFESFGLPTEDFLEDFARTFARRTSVLALSPESGVERIRRFNKTFAFSNEDLLKTIARAESLGVTVDVFFAMGIPGEKLPDLARTAALRNQIRGRFTNIGRTWTSPISLEPAAPWHLDPDAFDIQCVRRSFDDFYRSSAPKGGGLGYTIADYRGDGTRLDPERFEALLRRERCRQHCSLHPDPSRSSSPFWGRLFCRYMHWRTGGARG